MIYLAAPLGSSRVPRLTFITQTHMAPAWKPSAHRRSVSPSVITHKHTHLDTLVFFLPSIG